MGKDKVSPLGMTRKERNYPWDIGSLAGKTQLTMTWAWVFNLTPAGKVAKFCFSHL